ncbi:MAG: YicC family protein [Paludibacter sp.]|nr:YicC family protein [Bacteroidales bacterium]MCM1353739.1 YicC family protein [Bacteroides sp.]MCM1442193.1 YicC family protein [Muribaculum sp.]MCM1482155.1 YicC family protein [Paludibacter sp.]MCM1402437.1 YicC family protein [Bacteroides sp.]
MLLSMTGYGRTECLLNNQKYVIEIRSLNSKQLDLSLRICSQFREKEADIRALITPKTERGKVDVSIYKDDSSIADKNGVNTATCTPINTEALHYYMEQLSAYTTAHNLPTDYNTLLALAMRMPDVTKVPDTKTLTDEDWKTLQDSICSALTQFTAFRQQEGNALQAMFSEKLEGILSLLSQVEPLEQERIDKIRTRLEDNLQKLSAETRQSIDTNRLEQEMIFYLEKLDITEEKVRLRNHIRYFNETMQDNSSSVGKKLGFIAQEMGREINTLGSKSNHSEMQIIVVKMKDILEQIKEQVLNVL